MRLPTPPAHPALFTPAALQPSKRLLVVEDAAAVRTLVTRMLTSTGYSVESAEDGQQGWEALCAERFDLLITDHEMPRLTGLDLLRRVRSRLRELPVIFTSGSFPWLESDLPRLLLPGAILAKPFLPSELLAKVGELMGADCTSVHSLGG